MHLPRGGSGVAPHAGGDHLEHRGLGPSRRIAADLGGTFDVNFAFCGFVVVLAAADAAHPAGGQRLQVLPHLRDAPDHPSIIPIHPTHAEHAAVRPAWLQLSRDRLWLRGAAWQCGWRQLAPQFSPRSTSRPTRLGGLVEPASEADPEQNFRAAGAQEAPRERRGSVAGVAAAGGGGSCTRAGRAGGPDGLWKWSRAFPTCLLHEYTR